MTEDETVPAAEAPAETPDEGARPAGPAEPVGRPQPPSRDAAAERAVERTIGDADDSRAVRSALQSAFSALTGIATVLATVAEFVSAYGRTGSTLVRVTLVVFFLVVLVGGGLAVLAVYFRRSVTASVGVLATVAVAAITLGAGGDCLVHHLAARPGSLALALTSTTPAAAPSPALGPNGAAAEITGVAEQTHAPPGDATGERTWDGCPTARVCVYAEGQHDISSGPDITNIFYTYGPYALRNQGGPRWILNNQVDNAPVALCTAPDGSSGCDDVIPAQSGQYLPLTPSESVSLSP